nr:exopolysaccharide biosynthesis polyprenyl glycosylphosphotransferase [Caldovatus aquaticus]
MAEGGAVPTNPDLLALLANPALPAASRIRRLGARALRCHVAAADAAQVIVLALAARPFFPETAAAFGVWRTLGLGALAAVLAALVRHALHLDRMPDPEPPNRAALRAAAAVATTLGAMGAAAWLALPPAGALPDDLPAWFAGWGLASAAVAAALRHGAAHLGGSLAGRRGVVVVGAPEHAEPLARAIAEAAQGGWRLAGRVDDREAGGLDRLAALVERHGAEVVALALRGPDASERMARVCERLADQPVRIALALDAAALGRRPRVLTCIGRFALADLAADPHGGLGGIAKRAMDIVLGGGLLLALSPLLALVALAIRLESPGPALFRQWRFGLGSRPIQVFKFRTMRHEQCDATGERRTAARDPRVTRIGRILRRTSVDELPQLINVLRGEMSLVGPRPHPLHMRVAGAYYFEAVERYRTRHLVRPGITGWAQINGARGEVDTLEKARRRVALDLWYLDNWSLALDLRILLRTALGGFASPRAD